MNHGKYVFSQIVTFLSPHTFDRCVNSFQGDKWVKDLEKIFPDRT